MENNGLGSHSWKIESRFNQGTFPIPKVGLALRLALTNGINRNVANKVLKSTCALVLAHSCPLPSAGEYAWVCLMEGERYVEQIRAIPVIRAERIPDLLTVIRPRHKSSKFLQF